jgi:hypothetical protein
MGTGSRINFDYNPTATGSQTLMKSSVTSTPAPITTASRTGLALSPASPSSLTGGSYLGAKKKGYTGTYAQWIQVGRPGEVKEETPETPPEAPVIPEVPPEIPVEAPIIPANLEIPNTAEGIQSAILQSIQPSAEENSLQAQIDKEIEALGQGLVEVEDRPIALPFITGMSSSLEKRSALRTTPLQNRLKLMQDARMGKLQALQSQLGFKNDELTRQFQKSNNDMTNKITLATKGLRYDDKTDTFYR